LLFQYRAFYCIELVCDVIYCLQVCFLCDGSPRSIRGQTSEHFRNVLLEIRANWKDIYLEVNVGSLVTCTFTQSL